MGNIKNYEQFNESNRPQYSEKELSKNASYSRDKRREIEAYDNKKGKVIPTLTSLDDSMKKEIGGNTIVKVTDAEIAHALSPMTWAFSSPTEYTKYFGFYNKRFNIYMVIDSNMETVYGLNFNKETGEFEEMLTTKNLRIKREEAVEKLNEIGLSLEDFKF